MLRTPDIFNIVEDVYKNRVLIVSLKKEDVNGCYYFVYKNDLYRCRCNVKGLVEINMYAYRDEMNWMGCEIKDRKLYDYVSGLKYTDEKFILRLNDHYRKNKYYRMALRRAKIKKILNR